MAEMVGKIEENDDDEKKSGHQKSSRLTWNLGKYILRSAKMIRKKSWVNVIEVSKIRLF